MVRARRILEVIENDRLIERAAELGRHLLTELFALQCRHSVVSDTRGRGLMCALTLSTPRLRDEVVVRLREDEHVILLGCGTSSLRLRPALTVSRAELDRAVAALDRVLGGAGH
jgi:L-lysine 6-transaminase